MRRIYLLPALLLFVFSCSKENESPWPGTGEFILNISSGTALIDEDFIVEIHNPTGESQIQFLVNGKKFTVGGVTATRGEVVLYSIGLRDLDSNSNTCHIFDIEVEYAGRILQKNNTGVIGRKAEGEVSCNNPRGNYFVEIPA